MSRRFGFVLGGVLVGALLAVPAVIAISPSDTSVFVSLEPCAVFDTGNGTVVPFDAKVGAGQAITPDIVGSGDFTTQGGPNGGCGIPGFSGGEPVAEAVLLNVVAKAPEGGGNLKAWATDQSEPQGGIVNFQGDLQANLNNSNAVALPLRQDVEGDDITIKVNSGNPATLVNIRGVVLGYWTDASNLFLDKATYDPDDDGTVDAVGPFTESDLAGHRNAYCKLAEEYPASFVNGPCRATSKALDTAGQVGWQTSIAIGADGFPIISYYDLGNEDLKIVHCTTVGCSTTDTPLALDTTGNVGSDTSIAIGSDGLPIISYADATNKDLKVVHCNAADCSTSVAVVVDASGSGAISIAIGTDGYPIISYLDFTSTNRDLKVVHCTAVDCSTTGTPHALDTVGNVAIDTAIAIGTDGYAIISYYDATNGDLKVVHCTATDCSTFDTPRALDTTGNVGRWTSIAIGIDGFPIISYGDFGADDLKVMHCTATDCSTFDTARALDTTGNVGRYTSIAIGVDGNPVISYSHGLPAGDLKLLHCTAVDCSTTDTPQVLDSTGDVGAFSSIAIGVDGYPIISYYDSTFVDLKVARPGA